MGLSLVFKYLLGSLTRLKPSFINTSEFDPSLLSQLFVYHCPATVR